MLGCKRDLVCSSFASPLLISNYPRLQPLATPWLNLSTLICLTGCYLTSTKGLFLKHGQQRNISQSAFWISLGLKILRLATDLSSFV